MQLNRHFLISDDLDVLDRLEADLQAAGLTKAQIHVLTLEEDLADQHNHLNQVLSLTRNEIIRSTIIGACIGVCAAFLVLIIAFFTGWTNSPAGWLPFVFLAIIALGFFTWQGGLAGIETPNTQFQYFERTLNEGRHVFFVDLDHRWERPFQEVVARYPSVDSAGVAGGKQHWLISGQERLGRFFKRTFP